MARRLIANFFAKLKQYRAIATRYDKLVNTFLGGIFLASAVIWLNLYTFDQRSADCHATTSNPHR